MSKLLITTKKRTIEELDRQTNIKWTKVSQRDITLSLIFK